MTDIQLSIVIPCRNEQDTIADAIASAQRVIKQNDLAGEVIVADNNSTDQSSVIAIQNNAIVVEVPAAGYGNALKGGIEASRGEFIVMGDADGSYNFADAARLLAEYRKGHAFVVGCRLPAGGGTIEEGAMPLLHRWIGNPALTFLARFLFRLKTNDIYCGLRGFSRKHYDQLQLEESGMEFAVEMIVKSALMGLPIKEIPITLSRDGRTNARSHLQTFPDGWRTMLFLLSTWFSSRRQKPNQ